MGYCTWKEAPLCPHIASAQRHKPTSITFIVKHFRQASCSSGRTEWARTETSHWAGDVFRSAPHDAGTGPHPAGGEMEAQRFRKLARGCMAESVLGCVSAQRTAVQTYRDFCWSPVPFLPSYRMVLLPHWLLLWKSSSPGSHKTAYQGGRQNTAHRACIQPTSRNVTPLPPALTTCDFLLPNSGYGEVVQLDVLNDFIQ